MKAKFIYPILFLMIAYAFASNAQTAANWKLVGPIQFPTNKSGQVNGMGRVSQIVFHPTDPNKMYATGASGGLFISTDGADTWLPTGTDKFPHTAFSSICIDFTNDQIIYLGTGDANYYSKNTLGVFKSTDGGATWISANTGIGSRLTLDILMQSSNHKVLVAATNDGIWKSMDAGTTWTEKETGGDFRMMKVNPVNPNLLFAVTSTTFFRSTDFGDTWSAVTLPATNIRGGRIGVSKADSQVVYVTFLGDFTSGFSTPVYKSTDAGLTFKTVKPANSYNLNGYNETSKGQGGYNYGMTVDPLDANNVWVCGHCVFNSRDGGITWNRMTSWARQMHTDMHQIVYSPHNDTLLFNANDGGVWRNKDGGKGVLWMPKSNGLACTECYHATQSNLIKDRMVAGTQDNGEVYYDVNSWYTSVGGDVSAILGSDYQTYNMCYYPGQGKRKIPLAATSQSLAFPFTSGNETIMEFTPLSNKIAFVAENDIYRTDNLAANPLTWIKISAINELIVALAISPADANRVYAVTTSGKIFRSDNALNASPSFTNVSSAPSATNIKASIVAMKSSPNVVYLSCGSQVYRSSDKGVTWTTISTGLPPINFIKMYHDIYSTDESVYIANGAGAVYYKNKNLTSWFNYSNGLPSCASIKEFMIYNLGDYTSSVLKVAYYGRGVWETPLISNVVTGVEKNANDDLFALSLFPNPSKDLLNVSFALPQTANSELIIYDLLGKVATEGIDPQLLSKGTYRYQLNVSSLPAGVYVCKLRVNGAIQSKLFIKE
jgi:photosystem II stability/assembly factor-like uncharacterized protein